jgi:pimeloyl-ACP methyl ester carboxylesterase
VTVLRGEGTTEIIYGTASIPAGPVTLGGYIARPDLDGEWPTVLVFGPEPTPTSAVKAMCRRIARHALVAVAPDMTGNHSTNRQIALSVAGFVSNKDGGWSNAQHGYGVIALGAGIHDAAALAADDGRVLCVAMVGSTLDDAVTDDLAGADVPVLFVGSRDDDTVDIDGSIDASHEVPRTAYAIYNDVGSRWWDIESAGWDEEKAFDTFDRLVGFFGEQLPERV